MSRSLVHGGRLAAGLLAVVGVSIPPGVWFAILVNALIILVVVLFAAYIRSRRATRTQAAETDPVGRWYVEAVHLAEELQQLASDHEGTVDHDRLQRRVLPLGERVRSHARSAPKGVEGTHMRHLHDLGEECYAIGMEHRPLAAARSGTFIEDKLEELEQAAAAFESTVAERAADADLDGDVDAVDGVESDAKDAAEGE